MGIKVAYEDELLTFVPFCRLSARLRAGAQGLARAVALYGENGFLPWTFDELRGAAGVGRKELRALVEWIERLGLGVLARRHPEEDAWEEADVTGICLRGMLRATVIHSDPTDVATPGVDLQRFFAEALAAALPAAMRAANAQKKQEYRANNKEQSGKENVQDKTASQSDDVQDTEAEKGPNVQDMEAPSHAGAGSIDSNRVDIDSSKSYSSNSIDSNRSIEGEAEAMLPPELLEADVIQMLMERSLNKEGDDPIPRTTAEALVRDHTAEYCLEMLLVMETLPTPPTRPAGWLQAAIKNKKRKVPPEIVARAQRMLSPRKAPRPAKPRPAAAPVVKDAGPISEESRVDLQISVFEATMSPEQSAAIDAETVERMAEPHRNEIRMMRQGGREASARARGEFRAVRKDVVRDWALRERSDGPGASQGGTS